MMTAAAILGTVLVFVAGFGLGWLAKGIAVDDDRDEWNPDRIAVDKQRADRATRATRAVQADWPDTPASEFRPGKPVKLDPPVTWAEIPIDQTEPNRFINDGPMVAVGSPRVEHLPNGAVRFTNAPPGHEWGKQATEALTATQAYQLQREAEIAAETAAVRRAEFDRMVADNMRGHIARGTGGYSATNRLAKQSATKRTFAGQPPAKPVSDDQQAELNREIERLRHPEGLNEPDMGLGDFVPDPTSHHAPSPETLRAINAIAEEWNLPGVDRKPDR